MDALAGPGSALHTLSQGDRKTRVGPITRLLLTRSDNDRDTREALGSRLRNSRVPHHPLEELRESVLAAHL